MPAKYSDEFKRDSVALELEQGMSQRQVDRDMEVWISALQVWVRDAELQRRGVTLTAPDDLDAQRGQTQRRKRIRELEMENENLRRASAYLPQASLRVDSARPNSAPARPRDGRERHPVPGGGGGGGSWVLASRRTPSGWPSRSATATALTRTCSSLPRRVERRPLPR